MPFVLPRSNEDDGRGAFVLAFGALSMLEAYALLKGSLSEPEKPSERVGVFRMGPGSSSRVAGLAGIHKFATLLTEVRADGGGFDEFVSKVAGLVDRVSDLSLSGYGLGAQDYEDLLQCLLEAFRGKGFRKIHLLRPKDHELRAGQVAIRKATDVIAFPYHGAFCLGVTTYVSDSLEFRERGMEKPVRRSDISLSPRLAKSLVNLTGVGAGQTLLDPFCGSGTILAEGLLKAIRCVGIDTRRRLVEEARMNLRWISERTRGGAFQLETGDARELGSILGRRRVDGVATEPILLPRLRGRLHLTAAKEMIDASGDTYAQALASISTVVKPGGRIVMVVPVLDTTDGSQVYVGLDGRPLGLSPYQPGPVSVQYPVHLSFESTRWIRRAVYVFEVRP